MSNRSGDAGPLLLTRTVTLTIPNITDGDHADVACPADARFADAGGVRRPVGANFAGAPLDNLGILGAWVSNATTGVVTVRFAALSANVATADCDVLINELNAG